MNEKCRKAITLSTRFKGGAVHFAIRLFVVRVKVVRENGEQDYCIVEWGGTGGLCSSNRKLHLSYRLTWSCSHQLIRNRLQVFDSFIKSCPILVGLTLEIFYAVWFPITYISWFVIPYTSLVDGLQLVSQYDGLRTILQKTRGQLRTI